MRHRIITRSISSISSSSSSSQLHKPEKPRHMRRRQGPHGRLLPLHGSQPPCTLPCPGPTQQQARHIPPHSAHGAVRQGASGARTCEPVHPSQRLRGLPAIAAQRGGREGARGCALLLRPLVRRAAGGAWGCMRGETGRGGTRGPEREATGGEEKQGRGKGEERRKGVEAAAGWMDERVVQASPTAAAACMSVSHPAPHAPVTSFVSSPGMRTTPMQCSSATQQGMGARWREVQSGGRAARARECGSGVRSWVGVARGWGAVIGEAEGGVEEVEEVVMEEGAVEAHLKGVASHLTLLSAQPHCRPAQADQGEGGAGSRDGADRRAAAIRGVMGCLGAGGGGVRGCPSLHLNYADIISAWSDQGHDGQSPWMDDRPPSPATCAHPSVYSDPQPLQAAMTPQSVVSTGREEGPEGEVGESGVPRVASVPHGLDRAASDLLLEEGQAEGREARVLRYRRSGATGSSPRPSATKCAKSTPTAAPASRDDL
ncbi:hypothetical protein CLOM_g23321 [Closterium sp. NIES-68]|nr:hypothetical protein CLOM_g23321 [Closterium sp. NIES-68]